MAITTFDTAGSGSPTSGTTGGNTGIIVAVIALGIVLLGIYLYTQKDKDKEQQLKQAA